MARISGREVPNHKVVMISLTYVFGIGRKTAMDICEALKIDPNIKMGDVSEDDLAKIRAYIDKNYKVEGDLRTERAMNIKRLIDIGCYRGIRHKNKLPVRGQRTQVNARSHKGARANSIGSKKK